MRIAVYPHVMEIGGSQLNAVELAAGVRDLGHEVILIGRPGPLLGRSDQLGLEFVELPEPGRRPSRRVVTALQDVVAHRGIELVHGYEWTAGLESYWAARRSGTASVCTVMSMAVAPFLPLDLPLVVGTEQIAESCRQERRDLVSVIEPPIDLQHNGGMPGADVVEFRRRHGVRPEAVLVVMVTRLAAALKLEGILTAIEVVGRLADETDIQLVLVGDGPERAAVDARVESVNAGRAVPAVIRTGELADPRPAYAAADICLGMGGSVLRAMAFGKPVVVQGERGFWARLDPQTLPEFLWAGWYGVGEDAAQGVLILAGELRDLIRDRDLRSGLGEFAGEVVRSRFGLDRAARRQEEVYLRAAAQPGDRRSLAPAVQGAARFARYKVGQRRRRWLGRGSADDFNAVPVAARRDRPVSAGSASLSS